MLRRDVLGHGWLEIEEQIRGDAAVACGARICYQSATCSDKADARVIRRPVSAQRDSAPSSSMPPSGWGSSAPPSCGPAVAAPSCGRFLPKEPARGRCRARLLRPAGETAALDAYVAHIEASFGLYERLLAAGWKREQALGVVGQADYTEFMWTASA